MNASSYRWVELTADSPMPLLERRRVIGEKVMISHVRLMKGCDVPMHSHDNEQMSCVLSGRLRFMVADTAGAPRTLILGPGEVLHLPSNVPHAAFAEEETEVLDIFAPPSTMTGIDRR